MLIAAKAPLPGRVKTRLSPPLPPELAARLAEAFLADVLTAARSVDPGAGLLCPGADVADLRGRFPGTAIVVQAGAGLTGALADRPRDGAVVVAGDAPGIRPETIAAALAATADVVLAPSHDGGFGLIRLRGDADVLFAGIVWSTGSVLDQTVAAARAAGLGVRAARCRRRRRHRRRPGPGSTCPGRAATRAVLETANPGTWDQAHARAPSAG